MPIASIMSARTGQAFDVEFSAPPTEEDIDEATSAWETQFYQREGLDPSIAEQGVLGTAGNAFARDLGGVALDTVGGVAKGAAETKRALGPAGEALRLMPGMSTVMSLGGAGDAVAGFTDAVRERGREVYPTNPANPVAETIGGGAGQAVAMLGTMGAAAPVMGTGAALTVVPSVLGGTMGLGSGIDTAKDMGIDNPAGRLALGAAFGGAEAITRRLGGIGGKAAAKALQQGVRAGLKQAGKSVLSEAIEEPISGTLQDAATFTAGQFVADPNRPGYTTNGTKLPALDAEFLKRRKLEAIGGAAGGVVFGGLQMVGTQAGRGEEGKRGAGEPGPPPLPVREDLGELTAEDVADLEGATAEASSTVQARAPILTNVPDRVEPTTFQSGPGTTDAEPGSSASSVPAPVADVIETAPSPGTVADASVLPAAESPVEAVGTPVPVVGELPTATAPVAEFDLFGEAADPEPATSYMDQIETSEVPITQLSLSSDVPQFKDGANAQGVVEPLEGKYQRLGTGPILVWERTNGKREVISGRHRFDLAKRTGEKTIPAQVVREADGFTLQHAITADAELNIRDGQGKAKDYANYFRNSQQSGRTRAEAEAGGLLSRALGRSGWTIGTQASAEVFDLHANDKLSTQAAEALARTAPNNEALQRVGAQSILDGQPIDVSVNLMRALQSELGGVGTTDQLDLFGSNDSAMQAMKQQAKRATEIQRGLREQISAVQGAAKRPDQAAKLGVNVKDPASILKRVESLKGELLRWESWPMHTDLREQVRGEQRVPTAAATAPADLGLLLEGTESTRPMNRGETATPQAADPLAELGNAKRAGEAEQAQGKMGFKNLDTSGKTAGFVNGDILSEAADLIRSGITDFAAWSKSMVTRFGQAIRQYLQGIWEQVSAALPTDASKNVRLGSSAKAASVGLAQGGFVMGPNRVEETKARFARPEQQERLYQVREDVTVKAAAEAWVDSLPMAEAVAAMEAGRLPADMTGDVAQHAAGLLIQRTTEMMKSNQEVVQMQARSLGQRISKVWQGWLSQEAGRNLRQRSVVSSELTPYAPILAAEGMLIDRADAVMDKRYEGGAEGGATKVNETAADAGDEAGDSLADDLEGDTPERKAAKQQVRKQMAPAKKKLSKAQRTADRILQQLSERYADPPLMDANGLRKVDPVRALYQQHVQTPMVEADFVQQMMALDVPEGLAGTLWEASRLEIEARETLRLMAEAERAAAKDARQIEVAENRASRLIYRTEERLRQGSKDLSRSTDGDSINKVFRDKVKDDIGWDAFRDRLAKLRVGEDIAARLWRTAERERIDQAAMVRFREERKAGEVRSGILAKGSQKLRQMLNDLRKKIAPDMTWADIFMELPASQKERQREIYRRLMLDERLKGLSKDERLSLTNELDKAWQQERRKVFLRELERVGIGEKAAADKAKVVKALPKLIRLINLGMMNSEMFREAIAPEYGLKQITTGQALALRKLAEEAYALPEGVLRSRKLAALLDGIQKSTGTGLPEVLNQYWVAAVLSGMRTQFDTFMSLTNGFGNQLIQSGMLAIKNGNRAAAMVSMLEWWRGLKQAFPEAMQILSKGDYSYLKRFNDDLRKALEGETTFRPVPLGEALWRDGNAMEKYGFAPVMIWTGRLMAAADHLNNSATTAGAKVVARALHPELYKTVSASQSEREAAAAQARREVTGGAMPATAPERATVAARTREILNGQLRPEEVKEAAFMGDQAAYQNDPTGVFGGIYRAVNQGLGTLERGLQAYAEERGADGPAGRYARGMMLFFSGAMRSMMGAKFIRFGANFGNDMLGYVPGTVLVSPALLGTEATRSQRQLLMGKNVFGLMAGLTVAAMFLGKDDEEEGWHMEGPWSDLTPEEVKQRRAAGFESLTFWKRTADKVERVSYKQWPTAGLLAGVAHMQDRQRFRPEKWAKEGMAGHLLAAATVGAFQVKDVSAMRGLADLLGASKFGANPEDALVEKMAKMPVNFAGGFIPTLVKDLDALADSRRYKPETVMEEFLRNVPLARRAVAGGRPEINILGVAIEQDRKPWSRAYTDAESGPAHAVLGSLSARGFTLPTPETNRKVWKDGAWSTIAAMGADAEWRYQKKVGDGYRAWLGSSEGRALLTMPDGLAVQKLINRQADTIKRQALQAVMK